MIPAIDVSQVGGSDDAAMFYILAIIFMAGIVAGAGLLIKNVCVKVFRKAAGRA